MTDNTASSSPQSVIDLVERMLALHKQTAAALLPDE